MFINIFLFLTVFRLQQHSANVVALPHRFMKKDVSLRDSGLYWSKDNIFA
jgi:hypothetical protein